MNNALKNTDIEAWRARAGMSKKALAAALGVNYDFFIRVLNGKTALSAGLVARFQAFAASAESPLPPPAGGQPARDSLYSDVIVVPVRFTAEEWQEIADHIPSATNLEEKIRDYVLFELLSDIGGVLIEKEKLPPRRVIDVPPPQE